MFHECEITPDFEAKLHNDEKIIIAHNLDEAIVKSRTFGSSERVSFGAVQIEEILQVWKGYKTPWSVLENLNILDLASGSALYQDYYGITWYPQFARLCSINGANVYALDECEQYGFDKQLFKWEAVDLIETVVEDKLKETQSIMGVKFNIINSTNFIGSNTSPNLVAHLSEYDIRKEEFESLLTKQAGTLLKEGGFMTLNTHNDDHFHLVYIKRNGKLITLDVDF
jgi:hypothetical protein